MASKISGTEEVTEETMNNKKLSASSLSGRTTPKKTTVTTIVTTEENGVTKTKTTKRVVTEHSKEQKMIIQGFVNALIETHETNGRFPHGAVSGVVQNLAKIGIHVSGEALRVRVKRICARKVEEKKKEQEKKEKKKKEKKKQKKKRKKKRKSYYSSSSSDSDDDSSSDEEEEEESDGSSVDSTNRSKKKASRKRKTPSGSSKRKRARAGSPPQPEKPTKKKKEPTRPLTKDEARLVAQAKNEIAVEAKKRKRLAGRMGRGEWDLLIISKKKELGIPDDVEVNKKSVQSRMEEGRKLVCNHMGPISPLAELEDLFVEEAVQMVKAGQVLTRQVGVAMINNFIVKLGYKEKLIAWKNSHGTSWQSDEKKGQISPGYWSNFLKRHRLTIETRAGLQPTSQNIG